MNIPSQNLTVKTIREFAKTSGAMQVWRTWRDTMLKQGRQVKPEYMNWVILPQRDIELDAEIAFCVIDDFITWALSHPH